MIDLNVIEYPKRLAVLYSGGADSTLLYYLTASSIIKNQTDHSLDLLIVDRYNKPLEKATEIFYHVKQHLGDSFTSLKFIQLPEDIPGNLQVLKCVELESINYDAILWGVNQYPADISIRPMASHTVNFSSYTNHPKLKLPFANYSKADIISTFIELELEDILHNTHSCGQPVDIPCGKCFNCRERTWAYRKLGLEPNLGI